MFATRRCCGTLPHTASRAIQIQTKLEASSFQRTAKCLPPTAHNSQNKAARFCLHSWRLPFSSQFCGLLGGSLEAYQEKGPLRDPTFLQTAKDEGLPRKIGESRQQLSSDSWEFGPKRQNSGILLLRRAAAGRRDSLVACELPLWRLNGQISMSAAPRLCNTLQGSSRRKSRGAIQSKLAEAVRGASPATPRS